MAEKQRSHFSPVSLLCAVCNSIAVFLCLLAATVEKALSSYSNIGKTKPGFTNDQVGKIQLLIHFPAAVL